MDEMKFEIQIKAGDLYDYMLRHTYHGAQGLLGSCVGALAILLFLGNHQVIYLIAGIVLLAYLPWTLFLKSRQQMLTTPAFKKPLNYVLNEEGISVSQDGVTECQKWEDMHKAVSTSKSIIVYTNPVNACIFPRRELGDKQQQVIAYISTHMDPKKVNIRY
jgi:hypothetical protein